MIQDLKADSARWEQERRSHSGGTKASRGSPDSFMRSNKSNSPPARYSESSHRFSGAAGGPAQYETSDLSYPCGASCDSYTLVPRYPGSDAPGYSGSNVSSSQPYQQYDNRTPGYNGAQYQGQGQPQPYPPPSVDGRYQAPGQASLNAPYNGQAYSPNHADNAPYVNVGAHQRYAQGGDYPQDARMVDASSSRVYSSGSGYPAQGPQDPRAAYYATSQVPGGVAYPSQPVDPFVGRGGSYPATSQPEYGTPAPQAAYQYVAEAPQFEPKSTPPPRAVPSTSTQAQTGHSGSSHSRREHRDRDSYSKASSDRHHRRAQQ